MNAQTPNYIEFTDPRLTALYDQINPFGQDSEFFCELAKKLHAQTIIDLGCGSGLLTCELAKRGHNVIVIDPSEAMLAIARDKVDREQVKWIVGSFEQMKALKANMVLMTSHVAQFFLDDSEWENMLQSSYDTLENDGYLVFDIRRFSNPPFPTFPTKECPQRIENTSLGAVQWWCELVAIENKRVSYELHYFFESTGEKIVSINELIFRSQNEITQELFHIGFTIETIYGNWDGNSVSSTSSEMIFVARKH
jgi:ubiquinone/menaquinone biosynthesis C-methylase UbiE